MTGLNFRGNFPRLVVAALVFLYGSLALAQGLDYKGEVFGGAGWGRFGDDEGSLGDGASFVGGVGFRPFSRIGIEFEVDRMGHVREFSSGVRFAGTAVLFSGNVVYYFSRSAAQPYVVGGVGLLNSDRSSSFPVDPPQVFDSEDKEFASNFGAGVKIFVGSRVSLRPEFRVFVSRPSFLNMFRTSISIGYHW